MTKVISALSPDGFEVNPTKEYATEEEAWNEIDKWMRRYERQGYYSSNNGKIPLDKLKENCKVNTTEN